MAEGGNTDQIQGISIGISADTSALRSALSAAKAQIDSITAQKTIKIFAKVNVENLSDAVTSAQTDIERITKASPIPIDLHFKVSRADANQLKRDVRAAMGQGVNIPLHFAPSAVEKQALKTEIQKALVGLKAHVTLTWSWAGQGPGGASFGGGTMSPVGGGSPTATPRVHEPMEAHPAAGPTATAKPGPRPHRPMAYAVSAGPSGAYEAAIEAGMSPIDASAFQMRVAAAGRHKTGSEAKKLKDDLAREETKAQTLDARDAAAEALKTSTQAAADAEAGAKSDVKKARRTRAKAKTTTTAAKGGTPASEPKITDLGVAERPGESYQDRKMREANELIASIWQAGGVTPVIPRRLKKEPTASKPILATTAGGDISEAGIRIEEHRARTRAAIEKNIGFTPEELEKKLRENPDQLKQAVAGLDKELKASGFSESWADVERMVQEGEYSTVTPILEELSTRLKSTKPGRFRRAVRAERGKAGEGPRKNFTTMVDVVLGLLGGVTSSQDMLLRSERMSESGRRGAETQKVNKASREFQAQHGFEPYIRRTVPGTLEDPAALLKQQHQIFDAMEGMGATRRVKKLKGGEQVTSMIWPDSRNAEFKELAEKSADLKRRIERAKGPAPRVTVEPPQIIEARKLITGIEAEIASLEHDKEGVPKRGTAKNPMSAADIADLNAGYDKKIANKQARITQLQSAINNTQRIPGTGKSESTRRYNEAVAQYRTELAQFQNASLASPPPEAGAATPFEAVPSPQEAGEAMAAAPMEYGPPPEGGPPGGGGGVPWGGGIVPVRVVNFAELGTALGAMGRAGAPLEGQEAASIARAQEVGAEKEYEDTTGKKMPGAKTTTKQKTQAQKDEEKRLAEEERGSVLPPTLRESQRRLAKLGVAPYEIAQGERRAVAASETIQGIAGQPGLRKQLDLSQLETLTRIQFISARSAALTLTQAAESLPGMGRSGGLLQAAISRRYQSEARQELDRYVDSVQTLGNTERDVGLLEERQKKARAKGQETPGIDKTIARRKEEMTALKSQMKDQGEEFIRLNNESLKAAQGIGNFGDTVKNVGIGLVSSLATTSLFIAGFAGLAAGGAALGYALKPTIDAILGWNTVTPELTKNLAEQIRQMNGATDATLAQRDAVTGLTTAQSDITDPWIKQRADIEAGNMALSDQVDMLHAARNIAVETALHGGQERGLTEGTGGLLGTGLFGIRGTAELLASGLTNLQFPGEVNRQPAVSRFGVGQTTSPAVQATEVKFSRDTLDFFNAAFDRGGRGQTELVHVGKDQKDEVARVAAFFPDVLANQLIAENLLVKNVNNQEDATHALQALTEGINIPDPEQLLRAMSERQIPAQQMGFRMESELQRQKTIPAQFAMGLAQRPVRPFGATFSTEGVGQQALGTIADLGTQADTTGTALMEMGKQGREALLNLVPKGQRNEFSALLGQIENLGTQIMNIELAATQAQVNQQTKEYNNQLRLANRSLQDAQDMLAGINGAEGDRLGLIEGENVALSRQATALQLTASRMSLDLQQRRINFQRAIAGFSAPGLTFAERAARMDEAKTEADYAQQQLDIQKQLLEISQEQFQNSVTAQNISLQRNIQDLQAQIALLTGARDVNAIVAASAELVGRLNLQQQQLVATASTYIEEGVKLEQQAIQTVVTIAEQTGTAFGNILGATGAAWNQFLLQARIAYNQLMYPGGYPEPPSNQHGLTPYNAAGFLGTISGATEMVVGEAGPETVAILRNPRTMPGMGGMGGGTGNLTISINFNNPVVREEQDLLVLTRVVTRAVEENLGRRAAGLGFGAAR